MIKSMTGFGRGEAQYNNTFFNVELKSVNHRYLDINIKCPKKYSYLEENARQMIKDYVKRGRVDVFINYNQLGESEVRITPNLLVAREYVNAMKQLHDDLGIRDDINTSIIARFPDVLVIENKEEDKDEVWESFKIGLINGLENLNSMRLHEGNKLKEDILERLLFMEKTVAEIDSRSLEVLNLYKTKLNKRIRDILDDEVEVGESRLAMEVAIFADKSSITEETVRFNSHISQFRKSFEQADSVGRKLDFLIQEMNREINTIGSKASDLMISNIVIDMKSELEKIREQVQNIE
ncbi:YicC/YloC family endoribonuclease [Serpentinicella alkaliphila]|uniref:Uncharacterized protein (TIGR00255 family) n=1 Tax=Serpentinicella alkaliphila TaxID=1734049 RepID=A0A4V2T2R3_9FIRM|nr:YicC/YloC family endoribonuclease [Serpentinicella alkaliphila]QUH26128.1 YicC family protein [Serpentinicella alkaliphila]TCP98423.1 uncharacterized protein (TIGR00255 family) [Serpentinicella alkaliphila]